MKQVSVREFKSRLSYYLKNLPVEITSHGKVVACIKPYCPVTDDVIEIATPVLIHELSKLPDEPSKLSIAREALKAAEAPGIPEDPTINGEPLYCDRCHHIEDKLIPHWEDGEEFQVCLYCKKKIKRP